MKSVSMSRKRIALIIGVIVVMFVIGTVLVIVLDQWKTNGTDTNLENADPESRGQAPGPSNPDPGPRPGPGPGPGPGLGPCYPTVLCNTTNNVCLLSRNKFTDAFKRKKVTINQTATFVSGKFVAPWPNLSDPDIRELDKQINNGYILFGYCDLTGPDYLIRVEKKTGGGQVPELLIMPIFQPFPGMKTGTSSRKHNNNEIIFEFENWLNSDGEAIMCLNVNPRITFTNQLDEVQMRNLAFLSWGEQRFQFNFSTGTIERTLNCNLWGLFTAGSNVVTISFNDIYGDIPSLVDSFKIVEKFAERFACEIAIKSDELITSLYVVISKTDSNGDLRYFYVSYAVQEGLELNREKLNQENIVNFKLKLTNVVPFTGVWKIYLSRLPYNCGASCQSGWQQGNQGPCQINLTD